MKRIRSRIANTCVPDEAAQVIWDDDKQALADEEAYQQLGRRFQRWLRAKAIIDADWKAEAEARLAAVSPGIETDNLLAKLDAELEADRTADDAAVTVYLESLAEIVRRANDAWRERAQKRLLGVTMKINASDARDERKLLEARGLVRGRNGVTR